MKILLAGGGTGGHITPILAAIKQIKKIQPDVDFLWIGTKNGPEFKIANENNIPFKAVLAGKVRRYFSFWNIIDFIKFPIGVIQSYFAVKRYKPSVCFSKGGYVSVPTVLACHYLKIPILLHESDVLSGKSNLFMAKYADRIALGFEQGKNSFKDYQNKLVVTGNPVREDISSASVDQAYTDFKLHHDKPVLLVIGGSQGAQRINAMIDLVLNKILEKWQVVHVVGPQHGNQILGNAKSLENDYHVYNFLDGKMMGEALAVATVIVSRAGANSLAEIASLGKPTIIIPYPFASAGHQKINAEVFEKNGAAILLNEKDLTGEMLLNEINKLGDDKNKQESLKSNMLKMANKDAGILLANEVVKLAKTRKVEYKKNPKILVFAEGTILMHLNAKDHSREEIVKQVKDNEVSVKDFANYIPIKNAVAKLKTWHLNGAKISYLTSRENQDEVLLIKSILEKYDFPEGDLYYRQNNQYKNIVESVKPDILIEDDCESVGGRKEMSIKNVEYGMKKNIKLICVKEFAGIDDLSDSMKELLK